MITLQSRFCTLTPISVFYMDIYSSSLRLFKIALVIRLLPATNRQYFILVVFAVTLASRYICFKYSTLIALKDLFFRSKAKRP